MIFPSCSTAGGARLTAVVPGKGRPEKCTGWVVDRRLASSGAACKRVIKSAESEQGCFRSGQQVAQVELLPGGCRWGVCGKGVWLGSEKTSEVKANRQSE